jgi:hypothetical protein
MSQFRHFVFQLVVTRALVCPQIRRRKAMKLFSRVVSGVLVATIFSSGAALRAGIINGSFEDGLTGWYDACNFGGVSAMSSMNGLGATDGNYFAYVSSTASSEHGNGEARFWQTFSADTDGVLMFDFSSSLTIYSGGSANDYAQVWLDGATIAASGGPPEWSSISCPVSQGPHTLYLWLRAETLGGGIGTQVVTGMAIDHVRLVPEPSTFVLFGTGALGFLACSCVRRRRIMSLWMLRRRASAADEYAETTAVT